MMPCDRCGQALDHDEGDDMCGLPTEYLTNSLKALNDSLVAKNAEYVEALEWYADRDNYDENHAPIVRGYGIDTFDEGRRARNALLDE